MELSLCILLFLSLFFYSAPCITAGRDPDTSHSLVQSSCIHASYPNLCIRTLSSYAGPAKTPNDVAQAAVSVSLSCAQKMSQYLTDLKKPRNARGALNDCVEQLSESVDELHKTLSELQHLTRSSFRWQMSNAETWVSAALTNEDTCLDGFKDVDGKIKVDVRRRMTNVAKVTSNALYLITRLDDSRGNP